MAARKHHIQILDCNDVKLMRLQADGTCTLDEVHALIAKEYGRAPTRCVLVAATGLRVSGHTTLDAQVPAITHLHLLEIEPTPHTTG